MKLINLYKNYLIEFQKNNISDTSLKILLCEFYHYDSFTSFVLHYEDEVEPLNSKQISILNKVLQGFPVQYAIKNTEFYNMKFYVNKNVLIPRPETEEVVFNTIKTMQKVFDHSKELNYVDLGLGSGNILLSIEKNSGFKFNKLIGVDISLKALLVARKNKKYWGSAAILKKKDMIKFLKNTKEKFDIISANPPYISNHDEVDDNVNKYEPHKALYIEPAHYYYEEIIKLIPKVMNEKFVVSFEIGYDLKEILESVLKNTKFHTKINYEFIKDMYGNDRILIIHSAN